METAHVARLQAARATVSDFKGAASPTGMCETTAREAKAREGIKAADAGGAWFQSALTRAALAEAQIAAGAPELEIATLIAEARELVTKSGGNSLLPRLCEAEARLVGRKDPEALSSGLRDAEKIYRAMGMPDPADRIAKELS